MIFARSSRKIISTAEKTYPGGGSYPQPFHIAAFGFCSILAQTIFVRELLALFSGSEFVIGFLLFSYLFWTGIGAILSGMCIFPGGEGCDGALRISGAAAGALLPITVIAIRVGRGILAFPPGELPAPGGALLLSFLCIAPFGLVYGSVYDLASRILGRRHAGPGESLARVYVFEAAGSLAGALVFFLVFPRVLSQFEAAAALAVMMAALSLLSLHGGRGKAATAVLLTAFAFLFGKVEDLDRLTVGRIYSGYTVEKTASSKYGELAVVRSGEVVSYFSGGSRLFSVPEPERTEEAVHIALFSHPAPEKILLAGGVPGGTIGEILKHGGVRIVDCLELDGMVIDMAGGLSAHRGGSAGERDEQEGRAAVSIIRRDARAFIAGTDRKYDLIIINTPAPLNLQWNRFYTTEFFRTAALHLEPGGFLALAHTGSENYLSSDQLRVLRTVYRALSSVFGEVSVLPGNTVHFLAGENPVEAREIVRRAAESGMDLNYTGEQYLRQRFSSERVASLEASVKGGGPARMNGDMSPVLPLYEQVLDAGMKGSPLYPAMARAANLPPLLVPAVIAAVFLALILFSGARRAGRTAVFIMGFCSFLFQMIVMISLQAVSGHIYHEIVMISALFMAGASVGASARSADRWKGGTSLANLHAACLAMILLLIPFLAASGASTLPGRWMLPLFYLCSLANGALTGAYYRSVVRNYFSVQGGRIPAIYYAFDLFGACIGAVSGGFLLLPVTGAPMVCAALAFVHAAAAVILRRRS